MSIRPRCSRHRGVLAPLDSWRASTVPVAICLAFVQSLVWSVLTAEPVTSGLAVPPASSQPLVLPEAVGAPSNEGITPIGDEFPPAVPDGWDASPEIPERDIPAADPVKKAEVMRLAREEYHKFTPPAEGGYSRVRSSNLRNHLDLSYSAEGLVLTPRQRPPSLTEPVPPPPSWQLRLQTVTMELDGVRSDLDAPAATPVIEGRHVSLALAPDCTEWFVNRDEGIEHGYTIEAPAEGGAESLRIAIAIESELIPVLAPGEGAVRFRGANGRARLVYRDLHVFDATGRELPSSMELFPAGEGGLPRIVLSADLRGAEFPVVVDPAIFDEDQMVMPTDTTPGQEFGTAADGLVDVVAIGAIGTEKVYLFHQDPATENWEEKTAVEVPAGETTAATDEFGSAVAVFRDESTGEMFALVGAPGFGDGGAAFLYGRHEGGTDNWGFLAKLQPDDLTAGARFGCSLDAQNTRIVVGAKDQDGKGAVYVFDRRENGSFTQNQKVVAPAVTGVPSHTPTAGDEFGCSVAMGGTRMVVGAQGENGGEGAAYLFRNGPLFFARYRLFVNEGGADRAFGAVVAMAITGLWFAVAAPFADVQRNNFRASAGLVLTYAVIAGLLQQMEKMVGAVAGALFGLAMVMNFFNDLMISAPGQGVGGLVFLYLFNPLIGLYGGFDPPDTIVPGGFNDPGMGFGAALVMLGPLLFICAKNYFLGSGAMYVFIATAVAAGLVPLTFALWQLLFWSAATIAGDPARYGKQGDENGDGLKHFLEFAMGRIPVSRNGVLPNPLLGVLGGDGIFRMTFTASLAAVGVLLTLLYSQELLTWYTLGAGPLALLLQVQVQHRGIAANQLVASVAVVAALSMFLQLRAVE